MASSRARRCRWVAAAARPMPSPARWATFQWSMRASAIRKRTATRPTRTCACATSSWGPSTSPGCSTALPTSSPSPPSRLREQASSEQSCVSDTGTQRWTGAPIMDPWPGPLVGAYLLIIDVARPCAVSFGRYRGGQPVIVQSGQILYIGSAGGSPQQPRLAQRILRHLTRSGSAPPHQLREPFLAHCRQTCAVTLPRSKKLHWHIDYLLDQ